MPSHKTHKFVDKLFLGKEREDVHAWMDEPYKWLGKDHRVLRHNMVSLFLKYYNDPEGFMSGMLHILTDEAVSKVSRSRASKSKRKRRWRR